MHCKIKRDNHQVTKIMQIMKSKQVTIPIDTEFTDS